MSLRDENRLREWAHVLELSKLKTSEHVIVLTGENSRPANVEMALRASSWIGAQVFRMDVPPVSPRGPHGSDRTVNVGVAPIAGNRLAIETLKKADLVIDTMGLLHSPEQVEILQAGTRMLMVLEPPEVLSRNLPELNDKRRVMAADKWLRTGKTMRVVSPQGTDITFPIGQFGTIPEYGFADEPGHWDHWPSGFNSTFPNEGASNGRLVIARGDMLFPFKIYVRDPIEIEIRDGLIRSIEGGFEATYLNRFIASYDDPDAYAVSHIGWGLQPKAKWTAQMMFDKADSLGMEARSFAGNFLFSTGPNAEAGGKNHSKCHIDIPMAGCSVYIDNVPMVEAGKVVAPDQLF